MSRGTAPADLVGWLVAIKPRLLNALKVSLPWKVSLPMLLQSSTPNFFKRISGLRWDDHPMNLQSNQTKGDFPTFRARLACSSNTTRAWATQQGARKESRSIVTVGMSQYLMPTIGWFGAKHLLECMTQETTTWPRSLWPPPMIVRTNARSLADVTRVKIQMLWYVVVQTCRFDHNTSDTWKPCEKMLINWHHWGQERQPHVAGLY